jgi:hypothetical protein
LIAGGTVTAAALTLPFGIEVSGDGGPTTGGQSQLQKTVNSANKMAQATVKRGQDTALGLGGGVPVGPIPAPTPGIHPIDIVNQGIQTVASTLEDAALGLGGVHVGPIPAPTPGIRPINETANAAIQTGAAGLYKASNTVGAVHLNDPTDPSHTHG